MSKLFSFEINVTADTSRGTGLMPPVILTTRSITRYYLALDLGITLFNLQILNLYPQHNVFNFDILYN